jgi:hypothetical protein
MAQNSLCGWGLAILQAHPTDPNRLFWSGGCHAGRDFAESLRQSFDQGQTFTDVYNNRELTTDAPSGFPVALIGGQGAEPLRWYLAINRDMRLGGSSLVRSDDDGGTWSVVLNHVGGGGESPDKSAFSVRIAALAYDPNYPDAVFVARSGWISGFPPQLVTSGVTESTDGGQTWNDLGNQQMGDVKDVALGIDGQNLFLASDQGVFRLSLQ